MPFDQTLASRIRHALARKRGIQEKKLFGCVAFLLSGNVLVGVWKGSLIVRLGPEVYDDVLVAPHVREFDITGKPMTGWVVVEPEGIEDEGQLAGWIDLAMSFVKMLPKK